MKKRLIWSILFTVPLFILSMAPMLGIEAFQIFHFKGAGLVQAALCVPVIVVNIKYIWKGVKNLARLSPSMESLIAIGTVASFIYSIYLLLRGESHHYYFESCAMILTLITLGKTLESGAKSKTGEAIKKLLPDAENGACRAEWRSRGNRNKKCGRKRYFTPQIGSIHSGGRSSN